MYLVDFPCILNISQIGNERAHNNVLYQDSTWNLFHNTIGIVKSEKIQVSCKYVLIQNIAKLCTGNVAVWKFSVRIRKMAHIVFIYYEAFMLGTGIWTHFLYLQFSVIFLALNEHARYAKRSREFLQTKKENRWNANSAVRRYRRNQMIDIWHIRDR